MPKNTPDIKRDQEVKKLRDKNKLSFRKISLITGEDVKNVWTRYQRCVGKKLSTATRK